MSYSVVPIGRNDLKKVVEAANLFDFHRGEKWFRKYYDYVDDSLPANKNFGFIIVDDQGHPHGVLGTSMVPIFVGSEKLPAFHLFTLGAEKGTGNLVFELIFRTVEGAKGELIIANSTRGGVAHDIWTRFAKFDEGPRGGEIRRYAVVNRVGEMLWQLKYHHPKIPNSFFNVAMRIVGCFRCRWTFDMHGLSVKEEDCFATDSYRVFWEKFVSGNKGVISSREPKWMQWRYDDAVRNGDVHVFVVRNKTGEILGYSIATGRSSYGAKMFHYVVLDIVALRNDVTVLRTLLLAMCSFAAKHAGVRLEYIGANPNAEIWLNDILDKTVALNRNTCLYKCENKKVKDALLDRSTGWFFGPFDGERAYFWGN